MRFRIVIFANTAVLSGAGGVEITEGRKTEAVTVGERFQGILHIQFSLTIGINGCLGHALDQGQRSRHAVSRTGRREDKFLHPMLPHGIEQGVSSRNIIEIIF